MFNAESAKSLDPQFRVLNSSNTPMYKVDIFTNDEHQIYKVGLAEGVPVHVIEAQNYFDSRPFSAESMLQLARQNDRDQENFQVCMHNLWLGKDSQRQQTPQAVLHMQMQSFGSKS